MNTRRLYRQLLRHCSFVLVRGVRFPLRTPAQIEFVLDILLDESEE